MSDYERLRREMQASFEMTWGKLADHDMRFDQVWEKLGEHDRRFDQVWEKLGEHDRRFDQVWEKLDEHSVKLDEHSAKLDHLTSLVPMMHTTMNAVLTLTTEVSELRREMRTEFTAIRKDLSEVTARVDALEKRPPAA